MSPRRCLRLRPKEMLSTSFKVSFLIHPVKMNAPPLKKATELDDGNSLIDSKTLKRERRCHASQSKMGILPGSCPRNWWEYHGWDQATRYLEQEFSPSTKTDAVPNAWKSNCLSYLIFLAQKWVKPQISFPVCGEDRWERCIGFFHGWLALFSEQRMIWYPFWTEYRANLTQESVTH